MTERACSSSLYKHAFHWHDWRVQGVLRGPRKKKEEEKKERGGKEERKKEKEKEKERKKESQ